METVRRSSGAADLPEILALEMNLRKKHIYCQLLIGTDLETFFFTATFAPFKKPKNESNIEKINLFQPFFEIYVSTTRPERFTVCSANCNAAFERNQIC